MVCLGVGVTGGTLYQIQTATSGLESQWSESPETPGYCLITAPKLQVYLESDQCGFNIKNSTKKSSVPKDFTWGLESAISEWRGYVQPWLMI